MRDLVEEHRTTASDETRLPEAPRGVAIRASRPFLLFDYFRVPYVVTAGDEDPFAELSVRGVPPAGGWIRTAAAGGPALYWASRDEDRLVGWAEPGAYMLGSINLFGHVVPDRLARAWFRESGMEWGPVEPVLDSAGNEFASIWRAEDGSVFLPFDPGEMIQNFWSEGYLEFTTSKRSAHLKGAARRLYYLMRPAMPRPAQLWLRRRFSRIQARTPFPRWPLESSLHDLYSYLFEIVAQVTGSPVPMLSVWPRGYSWALVLTHDVESRRGWKHVDRLRAAEAARGYSSLWNLVPKRDYVVDDDRVRELREAGFEVGVHGLHHDGRDIASTTLREERLPAMREHAARWGATGFRSPATHRDWDWMPQMGFDYDSSYTDTDPFEPQNGGCCTWLPYHNRNLVELPITLPQDSTVFHILERKDAGLWLEKAAAIKARRGMALILTHPDYMIEGPVTPAYLRFLDEFLDDRSAWKALPSAVASWWRRRADSHLELVDGRWEIVGPAAEDGGVVFQPHQESSENDD